MRSLWRRKPPSTFAKCLAVHMHHATQSQDDLDLPRGVLYAVLYAVSGGAAVWVALLYLTGVL